MQFEFKLPNATRKLLMNDTEKSELKKKGKEDKEIAAAKSEEKKAAHLNPCSENRYESDYSITA
jgi:hypothetical protein